MLGGYAHMITWSDNYLMGVERLDEEHRQLFQIAEQILDRMRTRGDEGTARMFVVREGLKYLENYFAQHAIREEAYMRQIQYDGYALHKMLHDDFRKIQLAKYQRIVDSGVCTKEDAWDFIGTGIGWLLEHITTADMAIVGKGILSRPAASVVNAAALENELNLLFAATLNMEADARVVSADYRGEPFGKALCRGFVYSRSGQRSTVISGIERSFLMYVANQLYGDRAQDEIDLVMSTVEMFSAQFWITLARQLAGFSEKIDVVESRFLMQDAVPEELRSMNPVVSLLFTSNKGKFFVSTNSPYMGKLFTKTA